MGETPVYLRARVHTRYPARITRLPWLAGPLVGAGFAKPRGLRRLTRKLAKALFFGLHGRLGLPARGEMEVPGTPPAGVRRIAINGANTAFLAYAQHLDTFLLAYNFAKRLKTLKGLTPYEYVCKVWTLEPDRFKFNPLHHTPGLNT